jgi:hypothetical protein
MDPDMDDLAGGRFEGKARRPLRIAASAEITVLCRIQSPVAKGFDTQRSILASRDSKSRPSMRDWVLSAPRLSVPP